MRQTILDYIQTWGSLDIHATDNLIERYNLNPVEVADYLEEFAEEQKISVFDLDPVGWTYEFILQEVRREIEEKTSKDILNDTKEDICVFYNYLDSSFNYSEEAKKEFLEIVKEIDEEDRSDLLQEFINDIS